MTLIGKWERLRKDHEARSLEFVGAELGLAITFCEMAISADDLRKAERNANNARRAFASALHTLAAPTTGSKSTPEIAEQLRCLEQLFRDLDKIPSHVDPAEGTSLDRNGATPLTSRLPK
jgi:hypothetical protein